VHSPTSCVDRTGLSQLRRGAPRRRAGRWQAFITSMSQRSAPFWRGGPMIGRAQGGMFPAGYKPVRHVSLQTGFHPQAAGD
jgi:hypothetical protein